MLEELNAKIAEEKGVIDNANARLLKLRRQRAELTCPFKVGDRLTNGNGIDFQITRIRAGRWSSVFWSVFGKQVKKDGNLGVKERELYKWDFPAIDKAQEETEKGE